eukprot:COSAG02_NODE_1569_length_11894_cov_51.145994_14_plen_70_part_00
MPTYKEGYLYVLGSGPAPPTSVPDEPEKHWFELRVLEEGLRLVHWRSATTKGSSHLHYHRTLVQGTDPT